MTKDYATLVAQVIPVIALAFGLEVRAILVRNARAKETVERNLSIGALALLSMLVAGILAGGELRALAFARASKPGWHEILLGSDKPSLMLNIAIALIFIVPTARAIATYTDIDGPKIGLSAVMSLLMLLVLITAAVGH